MVGYAPVQTALGAGFVAYTERGVVALDTERDERRFVAHIAERFGEPPVKAPVPAAWKPRLDAALAGDTASAPVDLDGLPAFHQAVLRETMRIPLGEVRSYGQLAEAAGSPRAARAVGSVMARNPVPLIVPCHRVVRGDGKIGEYGLGGPERKRMLLEREGRLVPHA